MATPIWGRHCAVIRAHLRQLGADLRHLLLAAVPPERLLRLRSVDPDRYQWVTGNGWPDVVDTIRAKPVEMAVVDPLLGGQARAHGIERLRLPGGRPGGGGGWLRGGDDPLPLPPRADGPHPPRRTCERWFTKVGLPS